MSYKTNIKRLLLFLYHKYKNRNLVRFDYTSYLSRKCQFEGMNKVGSHVTFLGRIGLGSYIGTGCNFSADIGRFTSIGRRMSHIIVSHPYKDPFVSTSPLFFSLKKQNGYSFAKKQMVKEYKYYDEKRKIAFYIGNDCWIGYDVCIIGGVRVGDGAVVLSRAIVTKDVPPYAIVGGIPAKVIGYRYDEETIQLLQKVQWWNKDIEWLKEHSELLCDMEKFKQYFNNNQK